MKEHACDEVRVPRDCRPIIGRAVIKHLNQSGYRVIAVAVGKIHTHALVELPYPLDLVKTIVGDAKRVSSRAVKNVLPGSVWSAGGTYKPVRDEEHFHRAFEYILYDQGCDAWTWSYKDRSMDGRFGRTRKGDCARKSGAALRSAPAWGRNQP
jgi:REP element-mobilizing transposase RayT